MRKILAAANRQTSVAASIIAIPTSGCHSGTAAVLPMRSTIISDVAGGINEIHVAKLPVGSRTTWNQTKMGNIISSQMGMQHGLGFLELVDRRAHGHEDRAEQHHSQYLINDEPRHDPQRHQAKGVVVPRQCAAPDRVGGDHRERPAHAADEFADHQMKSSWPSPAGPRRFAGFFLPARFRAWAGRPGTRP